MPSRKILPSRANKRNNKSFKKAELEEVLEQIISSGKVKVLSSLIPKRRRPTNDYTEYR